MNITKELSAFNRITFVEKNHSYLIDNEPTRAPSVTRLIHQFKKKFDVDSNAARVAKRENTTPEMIKAQWKMKNVYSTVLGSCLHKYIENFYCNKKTGVDPDLSQLGHDEKTKLKENLPKLVSYFQNFYRDYNHLLCVRNEVVLGDINDTKVCGMSDMLAYNDQTDQLEILDFKTNKKMKAHSPYGTLLYPFDNMTEGEINEYTIQLNTYKYFIEQNTNLKISGLKIIWFNTENDNYKVFELADIQPKIKEMFARFKSNSVFSEEH